MADVDGEYERFRRLAVADPRRAREQLSLMAASADVILPLLMERASRAGEGRVRQIVATAIRLDSAVREALGAWVERWLPVEADEFALKAIRDALAAGSPAAVATATPAELPRDFAATYRYVTERLCHQVRNSLALPDTELLRLKEFAQRVEGDDRAALNDILAGLQSGFERVARAVEYDLGDAFLSWSSIHLGDWLRQSAVELGQKFGQAKFAVRCDAPFAPRVWASPFLLHTVFANLWSNAVQAIGSLCEITVILSGTSRSLEALVIDNGPGFDDAAVAAVFQTQYSTKGNRGGRGLLEVAEAVGRLQGKVAIATVAATRRIQLILPLEEGA